jgi:deoxyadenosine/deoxycytidine kinase
MEGKPHKKPFTISLEGNVGSGKTRLINYLKEQDDMKGIIFIDEQLDKWQNFNGKNLLKMFYENPKRWSFTFQSCALLSMIERQLPSENAEIRIMERSPCSSLKIFAHSMFTSGYISEVEKDTLTNWLKLLNDSGTVNLKLDGIVYVKTSVPVAMDRISFRNREGEEHLTEGYAEELDKAHEKWLSEDYVQDKMCIVNGDKMGKDIIEEYGKVINWIKQKKIERDGNWLKQ